MADQFNLDIKIEPLRDLNKELERAGRLTENIRTEFTNIGVSTKIVDDAQKKLNSDVYKMSVLQTGIQAQLTKITELEGELEKIRQGGNSAMGTSNQLQGQMLDLIQKIKLEQDRYNALLQKSNALDASKIALQKIGLENAVKQYTALKEGIAKSPFHAMAAFAGILVETFDQLDQDAAKFRMQMGITRKAGEGFDKAIWSAAIGLANVGVKAGHIYDAMVATANAIGTSQAASLEMSKDMAIMTAQLGIAADVSAEFLRTMGQVGGTTMRAQTDMMFFAKAMSQAAGVPLGTVMKDIASASQKSYQFMSKSPMELVKAAVSARLLGTSLESAASTMKGMMEFQTSIDKEMLASVLLGESINLQNLRELSYRRDLKGVNEEILRLAKQAKFEQLDPIQAQHFADAIGKTTDEVAKMLQAEKEMNAIRSDPVLMEQYEELKRIEGMTKDVAKNTIETARYSLTHQQNQSRLAAVTNSWSRIVQKIAEVYMPTIDKVLKFVADTLDYISESPIVTTIAAITVPLMALTTGIAALIGIGAAGAAVGSALGGSLGGLSVGLRALSDPKLFIGVGVLIAATGALALFGVTMKVFSGIDWGNVWIGIGTLTLLGAAMIGLGSAIIGTGGIGAMPIVAGTLAVAAFGAALIPFGIAAEKAGKGMMDLGNGFKILVDGLGAIQNLSLFGTITQLGALSIAIYELNKAIRDIPDIKLEKLQNLAWETTTGAAPAAAATAAVPEETPMMKVLDLIKNEVSLLRMDMKSGGIISNVYLDGQLVSISLARSNTFANSIGPNTIR